MNQFIRLSLLLSSMVAANEVIAATGGIEPLERILNDLSGFFQGPLVTAIGVIAVVAGGLIFAFSDGAGMRRLASVVIGIGIAASASDFFIGWLGQSTTGMVVS